jgi:hypothetical protein
MEGLLDAFAVWFMAVEGIGGALCHGLGDHAANDTMSEQDGIISASAMAIVVFPVPLGPMKSQADGNGLAASFAHNAFGLERPANSVMEWGR